MPAPLLDQKTLKKEIAKVEERIKERETFLKLTNKPNEIKALTKEKNELKERLAKLKNDLKIITDDSFKKALGVKEKQSTTNNDDFINALGGKH